MFVSETRLNSLLNVSYFPSWKKLSDRRVSTSSEEKRTWAPRSDSLFDAAITIAEEGRASQTNALSPCLFPIAGVVWLSVISFSAARTHHSLRAGNTFLAFLLQFNSEEERTGQERNAHNHRRRRRLALIRKRQSWRRANTLLEILVEVKSEDSAVAFCLSAGKL